MFVYQTHILLLYLHSNLKSLLTIAVYNLTKSIEKKHRKKIGFTSKFSMVFFPESTRRHRHRPYLQTTLANAMAYNEHLFPPSSFIMTSMGYRITVKHLSDVIGRLLTVIFGVFQTSTPAALLTRKILRSPSK